MDLPERAWFTEMSELWPNQRFSFKYNQVLHEETSPFQHIIILDSASHGRALILDGIIQCTESDEFSYQEMISFLPLNSHKRPKNVLIVGGGDGGVAREVAKHPIVEAFAQVEIDERVCELSKKFLPSMAKGFASPKLKLTIGDGLEFMRNHKNEFDVIITDSSDPIGPATCLFTTEYFALLKVALKPNGIICSQAGNPFNCVTEVRDVMEAAKCSFSNVSYAYTLVPTYPTGQIGFVLATNDSTVNFQQPSLIFSEDQLDALDIKYYDNKMHTASFQLPRFVRKVLKL